MLDHLSPGRMDAYICWAVNYFRAETLYILQWMFMCTSGYMQKTNVINGLCNINYGIWNITLWLWVSEFVVSKLESQQDTHTFTNTHTPFHKPPTPVISKEFRPWTSLRLLIYFIWSVIHISKGRNWSCSIWDYFQNITVTSNYKKGNITI